MYGSITTTALQSPLSPGRSTVHHGSVMGQQPNNMDTSSSYEQSRRQVSSVVVSEEYLEPVPQRSQVTYVEVPVVEEIIRRVPKKQIVDVEKFVPICHVEQVERVVEIPEIRYIDRTVQNETTGELIRHVPKKEIREIPRNILRTIPKFEYRETERIIGVQGETVEIPVHEGEPRYEDKEIPVCVAQTIRPVISQGKKMDADIYEYEPQMIPVDVLVAKPVASQLLSVGAVSEEHRVVGIPNQQYNTLLRNMNSHLQYQDQLDLPYRRNEGESSIAFLHPLYTPGTLSPDPNQHISYATQAGIQSTTAGAIASEDYMEAEKMSSRELSQVQKQHSIQMTGGDMQPQSCRMTTDVISSYTKTTRQPEYKKRMNLCRC